MIPARTFTVPAVAQNRGDESNPAFSVDTPGPVPVTATWSHEIQSDGSTCTASAQGTLRAPTHARELVFLGLPPGPSFADGYQMGLSARKNADLRPVEFRLRGVRRARLPGPGARVQRATIALRRGDPGISRGESRRLRAAGWRVRDRKHRRARRRVRRGDHRQPSGPAGPCPGIRLRDRTRAGGGARRARYAWSAAAATSAAAGGPCDRSHERQIRSAGASPGWGDPHHPPTGGDVDGRRSGGGIAHAPGAGGSAELLPRRTEDLYRLQGRAGVRTRQPAVL